MPHPGDGVNEENFNGSRKQLSKRFKEQLLYLIPSLLSSENLIVKRINGQPVTCGDLCEYLKSYTEIFGSGKLPEPTNILAATAEANNSSASNRAFQYYNDAMDAVSCFCAKLSFTGAQNSSPWFRRQILYILQENYFLQAIGSRHTSNYGWIKNFFYMGFETEWSGRLPIQVPYWKWDCEKHHLHKNVKPLWRGSSVYSIRNARSFIVYPQSFLQSKNLSQS